MTTPDTHVFEPRLPLETPDATALILKELIAAIEAIAETSGLSRRTIAQHHLERARAYLDEVPRGSSDKPKG